MVIGIRDLQDDRQEFGESSIMEMPFSNRMLDYSPQPINEDSS